METVNHHVRYSAHLSSVLVQAIKHMSIDELNAVIRYLESEIARRASVEESRHAYQKLRQLCYEDLEGTHI